MNNDITDPLKVGPGFDILTSTDQSRDPHTFQSIQVCLFAEVITNPYIAQTADRQFIPSVLDVVWTVAMERFTASKGMSSVVGFTAAVPSKASGDLRCPRLA